MFSLGIWQRGIDRMAFCHGNIPCNSRVRDVIVSWVLSKIDNSLYVDAGVQQIECDSVRVIVASKYYSCSSRLNSVQVHQALRGTAHHDPWQIIVTKYCMLFQGTHTQDGLPGPDLVESPALNKRQPVVCKPAVAHRIHHDVDLLIRFDVGNHSCPKGAGSSSLGIESRIVQRTAQHRVFVQQQDLAAGVCGL